MGGVVLFRVFFLIGFMVILLFRLICLEVIIWLFLVRFWRIFM